MRSNCAFTLVSVYISALFCFVSSGKEVEKKYFSPVLNKYDFIDKIANNSKQKTTTHARYATVVLCKRKENNNNIKKQNIVVTNYELAWRSLNCSFSQFTFCQREKFQFQFQLRWKEKDIAKKIISSSIQYWRCGSLFKNGKNKQLNKFIGTFSQTKWQVSFFLKW